MNTKSINIDEKTWSMSLNKGNCIIVKFRLVVIICDPSSIQFFAGFIPLNLLSKLALALHIKYEIINAIVQNANFRALTSFFTAISLYL